MPSPQYLCGVATMMMVVRMCPCETTMWWTTMMSVSVVPRPHPHYSWSTPLSGQGAGGRNGRGYAPHPLVRGLHTLIFAAGRVYSTSPSLPLLPVALASELKHVNVLS